MTIPQLTSNLLRTGGRR